MSVAPEITVAEAFLHRLGEHGIERLYFNAGSDFPPIVEAYAALAERGDTVVQQPVLAVHENLAVGMAHGAYLLTGLPQAVMVHVSVGPQTGCAR